MDVLAALSKGIEGRGLAATKHISRIRLSAVEHETKLLPEDIVQPDGSLDLYDDVLKLLRPVFVGKQPAVQCGGWLGYIPLNDRYALEVDSRVPIRNLEYLIGRAGGYIPKILDKYTRYFSHTRDQPTSLFDLLADQLLKAFDRVWKAGLVKAYEKRDRVTSSPVGRIKPFESTWRTKKAGQPVAASSFFYRTPDHGPNRVIRLALERLLQRYFDFQGSDHQRSRIKKIRSALESLNHVSRPSISEIAPSAIVRYVQRLPVYHEHYADALRISLLVLADLGLAIRGSDRLILLPTILIDMANVFEEYARRFLAERLENSDIVDVKNGNKGGPGGAKETLFVNVLAARLNPPVTPDIVIEVDRLPHLIIDTKYKPPKGVPDRSDINQVICYGARYGCKKVMILYAGRNPQQRPVELVGKIGSYWLYAGYIDLGADRIEDEEKNFVNAVKALI